MSEDVNGEGENYTKISLVTEYLCWFSISNNVQAIGGFIRIGRVSGIDLSCRRQYERIRARKDDRY